MSKAKIACVIFSIFFGFGSTQAQEKNITYAIGVQPLHAWFFVHNNDLSNLAGTTGTGFQLDINRYRTDQLAYDYAKRHFTSGYMIQYMHFSNSSLGNAINISYFIEPFLLEHKNFSFRLRAAGGINFASNPYNEISNNGNLTYSSKVNGYLGFSLSAYYAIQPKLAVFLNASYSHFSNGNIKNPNYGVNFPNLGIGLEYKIKNSNKPLGKILFYPEKWRFDGALFLCNKSLPFYPKERFWTYGIYGQASYKTGDINAWTIGSEFYVDQSMRKAMDGHPTYSTMHYSNKLWGLLGGHEFLFNRCIFSQQLGVYLFKEVPGSLINRVYHRWGYTYKLTKNWMLGMNLNANLQKAFIFDGRLVYSFYR